jgi:hypothetical protein
MPICTNLGYEISRVAWSIWTFRFNHQRHLQRVVILLQVRGRSVPVTVGPFTGCNFIRISSRSQRLKATTTATSFRIFSFRHYSWKSSKLSLDFKPGWISVGGGYLPTLGLVQSRHKKWTKRMSLSFCVLYLTQFLLIFYELVVCSTSLSK